MKEIKHCPTCGAILEDYRYGFSKRYAYALKTLYLAKEPKKTSHLDLTKGQKDHFHFLEYWGLIRRNQTPHHWEMTEFGKEFLFGHVKIPRYIWVYKAHHIPQPEGDTRPNPMISIFESGIELINKTTALSNSTPHQE